MTEPGDADLMLSVKSGDVRSFEILVGRHQRPLINYFFRMTWDRQAAEDMAQEVFIRIYNHAKDYEPQAKFTTYMYRVARNLWIDRIRHEAHAPRTVSLDAPVDSEGDTFHDVVSNASPAPDARMDKDERAVIVRKAIGELPEEQQQVLLLAESKGMKYQEVAEVLGIPLGTVKSRMHAAMQKLKDLLSGKLENLQ
ncbi:MAG: RNA polymerase sigma-70 factor ECF [Planctomycetota bacterium]|nr:MAG: RNA polymerase sigma-70 factor ECF [Planctomycetota bacterium]